MPIAPGTTLTHYEILSPLGAGAMGEVWRAKDTRLEREVAIKVLPDELADDLDRMKRFEREAKTLASLNHPNLAHVYGIDQVEDTCFIAMELVPGEDLAARLARGPLPVAEALDVCGQIAEGLEAAHDAGVVHRDLKPANVRLTPDGRVKLLDFGLAKAAEPAGRDEVLTTEAGRILGTPAYMSPEQIRGKAVDRRTDLWAFGCILFESLTGGRAFEEEGLADLAVAICERGPDWSRLPADTPPGVRGLLARCLTRDPRLRLQAAGEARIRLRDPGRHEPGANGEERRSGLPLFLVGTVAVVAVALGYALGSRESAPAARPTMSLGAELPPGLRLELPNPRSGGLSGIAPPLAISRDGRSMVYVAKEDEGASALYIRPLGSYETRRLEGTANAQAPFFSPDGRWVGYFGPDGIYKVAVEGGSTPVPICSITLIDRPSASWARDDAIYFSSGINAEGRIERISAIGGEPEELTAPDFAEGESWTGMPQLLPDGRTLLFTVASRQGGGTRAALLDLESGEDRIVEGTGEAAGARFLEVEGSQDGLLLFAQSGSLLAVDFDPRSGTLAGVPRQVVEQVSCSALGIGHWDASESGVLAYVSGNVAETELVLLDRGGRTIWRSPEVGVYQHPRISTDGSQLLFDRIQAGGRDIWVYDLARDVPRRLTSEYQNMDPLWAPDGERVVFSRFVEEVRNLFVLDAGQVGQEPTRLLTGGRNQIPGTWSPEGQLLFTVGGEEKEDLWLLESLDDREAHVVLGGPGRQGFGALQPPNGELLAYVSDKSGALEVYVCSYPGFTSEQRVTFGGGSEPLWSGDGTELFFRRGVDYGEFYSVPISLEEERLRIGAPTRLFGGTFDRSPTGHQHYDVSPDGQRFALVETLASEARAELRVMIDWREQR